MKQNIEKKFTFSADEVQKLRDLQVGIVVSQAQFDGMQIYKNIILGEVYKRCGIDGEAQKGYSKSIQYNLGKNEIIYTETPINEDMIVKK